MTTEPDTESADPPERLCNVCLDPLDESNSSRCARCGGFYHLRLTNDSAGKDCGDVWINEEHLALEFGCARCLAELQRESGAPAVVPPPVTPLPPVEPPQRPASADESGSPTADRGRVKHSGMRARDIVRRRRH